MDGRLDEEAWSRAPVATRFTQGTPVEGIPAEEETEMRVLIGDDAIYVGARMYESDPSTIVDRLVRRDQEGIYDYQVENLVRRLRAKLELDPSNPQMLLTVRGLGYKLVTLG